MTQFCGFETPQMEERYNLVLYNTLYLLQERIQKLYIGESVSEPRFQKVFAKQYTRMFMMESYKQAVPRFSFALKELAVFLGVFEKSASELKEEDHILAPK